MSSNTIKLIIEVGRGEDRTYALSLEDAHLPEDSDERCLDGLSEGYVTDPAEVAETAADLVRTHILGQVGPTFGFKYEPPQDRH